MNGLRNGAPLLPLRRVRSQGGYSLVEVVVSLGILAAVLVAIASMFVLGRSNVNSGRKLTEATSIAQHVMEDVNKLSYNGLKVFFVGTPVLSTLTSYTADTRVGGSYANTQYQPLIDSRLHRAYALIVLQPIGGDVKPAVWTTGEAVRITVTVYWTELRRDRSVTVEGVRF